MTSASSSCARPADEPVSGRKVLPRAMKAVVMVLAWSMIGAAFLAVMPATQAGLPNGLFELGPGIPSDEGGLTDILGDGIAADGPDWGIIPGDVPDGIFDGSGDVVFPGAIAEFLKDDLAQSSMVDRTTYSGAGGSNKNGDLITDWHWATGNVPAKDDLSNAYAYATMDGDHLIIFAGFERIASNGDSHIDIEFFKDNVRLNQSVPCTVTRCDWLGERSVGDIIISMDFLKGGEFGTMTVREWDGTTYVLVASLNGEGCNADDTICGFNNGGPISSGPWPSYDSHGHEITTLPHNAFTEFGIDVTALEGGTPCLTTVLGKTRSSQSFTAELKDFAGPAGFPVCGASIAIGPDAVNEVGTEHTFKVWVNESFAAIESPAADGTIVTVDFEESGATLDLIDDNCADPGTVLGVCTVTFKSDTAGTITAHASADVVVGTDTIHVETDGTGSNSGDAVKRYVDAKISIAPGATNRVGQTHEFIVTVKMDEGLGDGWQNAPDGTLVTVSLDAEHGAAVEDLNDECVDPGLSSGTCSVFFTSQDPGTVTGHASVTLTFDTTVEVTRETDGVAPNSSDAVKVFVDARISISPDKVNEVGDTHTFVVTAEVNAGDGNGWIDAADDTIVTVVLTAANGAAVEDPVDDCADPGLSGGTCSVSFTSLTAGTVTGHASASLSVGGLSIDVATDGTGENGVDATKVFVDAWIKINPPTDTNSIGELHTFTVTVKQNAGDGLGFVLPPDDTVVTVELTPTGATIEDLVDSCADPGLQSGSCTVTFTSSAAGTVEAYASVSLIIEDVAVDRATDGTGQNSGTAVKTFVAGSIAWTKVDNANRKQGGATFEVCRIADWDSDSGTFVVLASSVCFDVTDNDAPDADPLDGQFLVEGLVLGRYTVTETQAPPGYMPDDKTETVELSPSDPDAVIADAFVNERPILKLTGFGYENTPEGDPTDGVVSGTTVYTIAVTNYGGADALLDLSFVLTVSGATAGTVTFGGATGSPSSEPSAGADCGIAACTVSWTDVSVAAGDSVTLTVTLNYADAADGTQIRADLTGAYTVDPSDGDTRTPSGMPAAIIFTIQAD